MANRGLPGETDRGISLIRRADDNSDIGSNVLKHTEAIRTLLRFIDLYPKAPERMRIGAMHQIAQQEAIIDGSKGLISTVRRSGL